MNGPALKVARCPYCQAHLNVFKKTIEIIFEQPKEPPPGVKDLGLKTSFTRNYKENYGICGRCEAKYILHYDVTLGFKYDPINQIPDDQAFSRAFLEKIMVSIPSNTNTIYKILKLETEGPKIVDETLIYHEKSKCFIANYIYGSCNAYEAIILQNFRDERLIKYKIGKLIMSIYYKISPDILAILERQKKLKLLIKKFILDKLVLMILFLQKNRYK